MVTFFSSLTLGWFIYVLFNMIREVIMDKKQKKIYVTLVFKDAASIAEGVVRKIVQYKPETQVELIDAGSTDDTPLILCILAVKYQINFCRESITISNDRIELKGCHVWCREISCFFS
ncbi:MAG: hypothetical protein K9L17_09460 [Clostridiales bacterium]|nr:hypothetical protein [Clostridiales bacterium]MCF8022905.1 hypothetical protein [Clostridiales bacterium]